MNEDSFFSYDTNIECQSLDGIYSSSGFFENRLKSSEDEALSLSAVFRCLQVIARTLSSMEWRVVEYLTDEKFRDRYDHDIYWLMNMESSPGFTAAEFKESMIVSMLLFGDSYAEIIRDKVNGSPISLHQIHYAKMKKNVKNDGSVSYIFKNEGREIEIPHRDILHFRNMSVHGARSIAPLTSGASSFDQSFLIEEYGRNYFRQGPFPGGILKFTDNPKTEELQRRVKSFADKIKGAGSSGRIIGVGSSCDFQTIGKSNVDSQYMLSREFSVLEICRWFGVPPHLVFDLKNTSYDSAEQNNVEFKQYTLGPHAIHLSSQCNIKFFNRKTTGRMYISIDLSGFGEGDTKTRSETLSKQIVSAIRTPNEARVALGLNPIEGGDDLWIQGAMKKTILDESESIIQKKVDSQDEETEKEEKVSENLEEPVEEGRIEDV